MKRTLLCTILCAILTNGALAQVTKSEKAIYELVAQYSQAREDKDPELLNSILTDEIDQLVSSGTWRIGKDTALSGMMKSSKARPGSRTITIDKLRFLNDQTAIADARYEITNPDGSMRKMWSTFIVVLEEKTWKIAAIRNMLPAK
ncbi:MAG: SgcJ/EcaC family oxidoreductase [Cyclobacteriaceae bacterium]